MLIGSSLDEVWGKGILKKKKKTKKKPDTIDDEILIPDTNRLKHTDIKHQINDNEFKYPGYDSSFDNTISSYSSNYDNIIDDNNSYVQKEQNTLLAGKWHSHLCPQRKLNSTLIHWNQCER